MINPEIFTVPERIGTLKPNEVFVFGSNLAGVHGAGAALLARNRFGAAQGFGYGLCGQSFAIPTKDMQINTLPLSKIKNYVDLFILEATKHPTKTFLITQIGCGLAGYKPENIFPLFEKVPSNCRLPIAWLYLNK
jgi:hypothetical protein